MSILTELRERIDAAPRKSSASSRTGSLVGNENRGSHHSGSILRAQVHEVHRAKVSGIGIAI